MEELSIFIDESGEPGTESDDYGLTLVFHDQSNPILPIIGRYCLMLADARLPDIPMHTQPLLNGNDAYALLSVPQRQRLLVNFLALIHQLPICYVTFLYAKHEFDSMSALGTRLKRDIIAAVFAHLDWFQRFDAVKVYYDGGQELVSNAVRGAMQYALSRQAVLYRSESPEQYRLAQAADFICTLELTARKYDAGKQTATDRRFFGSPRDFKRDYLRQVRRKQLTEG